MSVPSSDRPCDPVIACAPDADRTGAQRRDVSRKTSVAIYVSFMKRTGEVKFDVPVGSFIPHEGADLAASIVMVKAGTVPSLTDEDQSWNDSTGPRPG